MGIKDIFTRSAPSSTDVQAVAQIAHAAAEHGSTSGMVVAGLAAVATVARGHLEGDVEGVEFDGPPTTLRDYSRWKREGR